MNLVKEMVAKDKKYFMADQLANPANPLAHYETTGWKFAGFAISEYRLFYCRYRYGGTITGVTRRLRENFRK